jgi:hypothetical protein
MQDINFNQLVFSELRTIPINIEDGLVTDEKLTMAITINEELKSLGYTLNATDIINLAKADADTMTTFLSTFKEYVGDVKSKPMYPNFPTQVMNMDEATFRFHQMVHYFSTYGVESVSGMSVSRGWLPEVSDTDKCVDDATLLNAKVIALFVNTPTYTIYDYAFKKILTKRERMTDKDKLIISECVNKVTDFGVDVTFKENLMTIFYAIFNSDSSTVQKLSILRSICQHTGDVWKCVDYTLTKCKYHFRTSQKRLIVKLLEMYHIKDFSENLIISNKKGTRVNLVLQYLDYNKYSRKKEYKDTVARFRNDELHSWESSAISKIKDRDSFALSYMCSHPGTALRKLTYLLRNGYTAGEICKELKPYASKLSTQTLISLCTQFSAELTEEMQKKYTDRLTDKQKEKYKYGLDFYAIEKERKDVYNICETLLREKLMSIITPVQSKNVYLDLSEYDLTNSILLTNDKSAEGGYIRSGIAYKIPDNVNTMRFFVYWNHNSRTDIDLHAYGTSLNGEVTSIGWNSDFNNNGIVFSGDITHSDAAEYIDVDLSKTDTAAVSFNINVYDGPVFKDFDECFVGCMAVSNLNENVKLYNPKNCFFTHRLTSNSKFMHYGFLNVKDRNIIFDGKMADTNNSYYSNAGRIQTEFTLEKYLNNLYSCQNVNIVDNPECADYTLIMGKPSNDKEISLIDNNFFMDI